MDLIGVSRTQSSQFTLLVVSFCWGFRVTVCLALFCVLLSQSLVVFVCLVIFCFCVYFRLSIHYPGRAQVDGPAVDVLGRQRARPVFLLGLGQRNRVLRRHVICLLCSALLCSAVCVCVFAQRNTTPRRLQSVY